MTMRLLIVAVLGGCAQTAPPPTDDAAAFNRSLGGCRAGPVATLVGKRVTPALLAEAKALSHSIRVRTIAPGDLVSMDFRGDRLNIETNAAGRVVNMRCG